jgi:hypothetical protein
MDIHKKGLAIILTIAMALCVFGLYFGVARWTPKTGKEEGRPLVKSSYIGLCEREVG